MTRAVTLGVLEWRGCRLGLSVLCGVLLALATTAAQACEPPDPNRVPVDLSIVIYSDGSFGDAATDDDITDLQGRPVRDIGGGRVGQVIEEHYGCWINQTLLFVDCTTGSAIMVEGSPDIPEAEDRPITLSTTALQPPYGPLALTGATTVAEVQAVAAREGWSVETDVAGFAAERGQQNRFDHFLGCEIFYPGSVGAGR